MKITVIIPAKNDLGNLCEAIPTALPLGPVWVVDSGEHADIRREVEAMGAQYIGFDWDGRYPKKRNWALRHLPIETEWVLFLDADERIPPEFVEEVKRVLPGSTHDGFWVRFHNHFNGRRVRFGDPFRKRVLFRFKAGAYEEVEELHWSTLDMEVHEKPVWEGTTGSLHSRLLHRDRRGLRAYLRKHIEYARWEAQRARFLQEEGMAELKGLPLRERLKYQNLHRWWLSPGYFSYSYLFRLGFLDGKTGLDFACFKARYFSKIRQFLRHGIPEEPLDSTPESCRFSVAILTYNEEENLADCLDSVAWCDDVVVVDSYSVDRTEALATERGARVLKRKFDDFGHQRNFTLDQVNFLHPWVFFLDADERFNPALKRACDRRVAEDLYSGYFVPNRIFFMGRWIRHCSRFPYPQVRLVKKGEIRFEASGHGQRECAAQREVGLIPVAYDHYNFSKGMEAWLIKHARYAAEEVRNERTATEFPFRELWSRDRMRRRRAVKSWTRHLPCRPLMKFLYLYIGCGGFLDGKPGFVYCRMQAVYEEMNTLIRMGGRHTESP
jgi:glycosyltransferase involved in cell wall biosynthesis